MQTLCLLFQMYNAFLPEPVEVILCHRQTSESQLRSFLELSQLYITDRQFVLVGWNRLPHELQEVVAEFQLTNASVPSAKMIYMQVNDAQSFTFSQVPNANPDNRMVHAQASHLHLYLQFKYPKIGCYLLSGFMQEWQVLYVPATLPP